eukprot:scaffold81414_cov51-Phaeocystis_antarctica.AAC.2
MGIGQWAMWHWAMGNGRWAVGSGNWELGNGNWAFSSSNYPLDGVAHLLLGGVVVSSLHLEQQLLPLEALARGALDVQQVDHEQGGEELQLVVLRRATDAGVDERAELAQRLERRDVLADGAAAARDCVERRGGVEPALLRLVRVGGRLGLGLESG